MTEAYHSSPATPSPVTYSPVTIVEMLEKNLERCPDKAAVVCEEGSLTWSGLYENAMALGGHFFHAGIQKGDRIAVMMDAKTPELIVGLLGISVCGGIAVPIDCNQTDRYIRQLFKIVSPRGVFVSASMHHRISACGPDFPSDRVVVCRSQAAEKNGVLLENILTSAGDVVTTPDVSLNPEDTVYFNLTSGTTGFPKCAVTTHANVFWNTLSAVKALALTAEDVHLCMFPAATHPHELYARALFLGGTMVLTDHLAPKSLTKVIEDYKVTAMMAIAPIYGNFTKCHLRSRFMFTTLEKAESGGMHLDPITARAFRARFGIPIIPVWGSTETAGIALVAPLNGPIKEGSCGLPNPHYEIKVLDESGGEAAAGEVGEMVVKGPGVCAGYFGNVTETGKNFKKGWYHTGDMFKTDAQGYFYFSGREQGMMKVAGMKVFPVEIEDILIEHPLIKEVAVTKEADPMHGEIPKAVIVFEAGVNLTKKEIRHYCAEKMAPYKIPKILEFREALPRNPTGKILVNEL